MAERVPGPLELGREEWLKSRKSGIGASELAAIMGLNDWMTPYQVWAEKTGRLERAEPSEAMLAGNKLENALIDCIEERFETPIERQVMFREGRMLSTLDGLMEGGGELAEAKTYGLFNPVADTSEWGKEGSDEVPDSYLVQVQAGLHLSGAEIGRLAALIGGKGIVHYTIAANKKIGKHCREFVEDWWTTHIENDSAPDVEGTRLEVVKRIRREPNKQVDLDEQAEGFFNAMHELRKKSREHDKQAKSMEAAFLAAMEDAELAILPSGKKVTYMETKRSGYTVKPTAYRSLKVKK